MAEGEDQGRRHDRNEDASGSWECLRANVGATRFVVSSMAGGDRESKQGGANRPMVVASRATELLSGSGRRDMFRTLRMRAFGFWFVAARVAKYDWRS